ncbi:WD40 repeat-like protein [Venturia nashicola]|uniref:WD40 repeat-like protein n=1 Tax=Venturia nashicola TaxID=86259 RepID=A0A4Z1PBK0_9PEZI|nr:WD40 repeat-like protein [Venturia nashicola]
MSENIPQQISSIDTLFLETPPSCIQFSHLHPAYFVIGTYFLENPERDEQEQGETQSENTVDENNPQERTGSLVLCKLTNNKIDIINTCKTAYAILDVHFAYEGHGDEREQTTVFWTANSTGSIAEYEIVFPEEPGKPWIVQRSLHQLYAEDILVLSFCWHPRDSTLMSTTLSNGEVHVLRKTTQTLEGKTTWRESKQKPASHELEAWISCFSSFEGEGKDVLFSGGDDAVLQYTSIPTEFQDKQEQEQDQHDEIAPLPPTSLPKKFHNAGITSLLPLPVPSPLLLTGSYDDTIRLLRPSPRPTLLATHPLTGGVWRLKLLSPNPSTPQNQNPNSSTYDILASCMHAGTQIIRLRIDDSDSRGDGNVKANFEVLARFSENESMNYGSDVQPKSGGEEEEEEEKTRGHIIVSTSFYDKRVCLWIFREETKIKS